MPEQEVIITYSEENAKTYNCFCSLSEAERYHGRRLANSKWSEAGESEQRSALFNATDVLNRQKWLGKPRSFNQNLKFPREYVRNRNSIEFESEFLEQGIKSEPGFGYSFLGGDTIPEFLKDATAELAHYLLLRALSGKDEFSQYSDQVSEIKLGSLRIKLRPEDDYITSLPYQVVVMIKDFLIETNEPDASLPMIRTVGLA